MIRKGTKEDMHEIMQVIKRAVTDMIKKGIEQWDEIYPNIEVISRDIQEESLYVYEDQGVRGIVVLNEFQDKEYADLHWRFNSGKQLVIHRLCIDPEYQGKGIASKIVEFADTFALQKGYSSIRLDSFPQNVRACRLYERKGFLKVGTVIFRKGEFFCFEKSVIG